MAAKALERFNAGDMEGFWSFHHPECVMATDPDWPGGGVHEGLDAYRRFIDGFMEAFQTVRFEARGEPEPVGRVALFRGRWVGRGAASGIDTESPWFTFLALADDGKLRSLRFYFRDEDARQYASTIK